MKLLKTYHQINNYRDRITCAFVYPPSRYIADNRPLRRISTEPINFVRWLSANEYIRTPKHTHGIGSYETN